MWKTVGGLLLFFMFLMTSTSLASMPRPGTQQTRAKEADYYYKLGTGYFKARKYQEALDAFKQALNNDPTHMGATFLLADTYSALGEFEEATKIYTQLIGQYPHLPAPYFDRSYSHLSSGNGEAAAADALTCLKMIGWRNDRSQSLAIVAHFGYRRAGRAADATRILDEAAAKADTKVWPHPIIRYLRHEITDQELMKAATNNDKMTEARAYLGMDFLLNGHQQEALEHFQWVEANGKKTFLEYRLSLAEIRRMKNTGVKSG